MRRGRRSGTVISSATLHFLALHKLRNRTESERLYSCVAPQTHQCLLIFVRYQAVLVGRNVQQQIGAAGARVAVKSQKFAIRPRLVAFHPEPVMCEKVIDFRGQVVLLSLDSPPGDVARRRWQVHFITDEVLGPCEPRIPFLKVAIAPVHQDHAIGLERADVPVKKSSVTARQHARLINPHLGDRTTLL